MPFDCDKSSSFTANFHKTALTSTAGQSAYFRRMKLIGPWVGKLARQPKASAMLQKPKNKAFRPSVHSNLFMASILLLLLLLLTKKEGTLRIPGPKLIHFAPMAINNENGVFFSGEFCLVERTPPETLSVDQVFLGWKTFPCLCVKQQVDPECFSASFRRMGPILKSLCPIK